MNRRLCFSRSTPSIFHLFTTIRDTDGLSVRYSGLLSFKVSLLYNVIQTIDSSFLFWQSLAVVIIIIFFEDGVGEVAFIFLTAYREGYNYMCIKTKFVSLLFI